MRMFTIITLIVVGVIGTVWLIFWVAWPHKSKFSGPVSVENPLPDELLLAMEKYIQRKMKANNVPGLSMVFLHGSEIVYSKGFGERDFDTGEPVTTKTLFGIGSITKPITAAAIASVVDDGLFSWDTKVANIMPSFSLSDEDVTNQITIEDTLCMCTGVPRRMEEISVRYEEISAEDIIDSLRTIPLLDSYGTSFNYSSRMVSVGGYIAAMANGWV